MSDKIKYFENPMFLEWLEEKWNDSFCNMETKDVISELGMTAEEAIKEFEKEKS